MLPVSELNAEGCKSPSYVPTRSAIAYNFRELDSLNQLPLEAEEIPS